MENTKSTTSLIPREREREREREASGINFHELY
jgi:hypothetical protein